MSFTQKVLKSGAMPIYFLTCKDLQGWDCYYFLAASHEKMKSLKNKKADSFNLTEYGKIILSGYGNAPSEEEKAWLKAQYDIDA